METLRKTINQESYISRIVGLFPYYEDFENRDRLELGKYIKPATHCWGQVIPNLEIPFSVDNTIYEVGVNKPTGEILISNDIYSYRTIMDHYYDYHQHGGDIMDDDIHWFNEDIIDKDKTFAQWVELGIGRFLTPVNTNVSDAYYEWVYLGLLDAYKKEVNDIYANVYEGYVYRQERLCAFNNGDVDQFGWEYYKLTPDMMSRKTFNGETYLYLSEDFSPNNKILKVRLDNQSGDLIFSNNGTSSVTIKIDLEERKDYKGENHFDLEVIVPPGYSIIHLQTIGDEETNNGFNSRFSLVTYNLVSLDPTRFDIKRKDEILCCEYHKFLQRGGWFYWQLFNSEKLLEFIERIKQYFYDCATDNTPVGVDKETLSIDINLFFGCSNLDMGMVTPLCREWDEQEVYYSGDIVIFTNGETQTPRCYICKPMSGGVVDTKRMVYGDDESPLNTEIWELLTHPSSSDETYEIKGKTYSKLNSLRRLKDYYNEYNEKIRPTFPRDWLMYYRLGPQNINHQEINDVKYHYGDFIESIVADNDKKEITFTYWIDAPLIENTVGGESVWTLGDANGMFNGVRYTETYRYEDGGELDNLVSGKLEINGTVATLEEYVKGVYDVYKVYLSGNQDIAKYLYENPMRFEFDGSSLVRTTPVTDGVSSEYKQYIETEYTKQTFMNGLDDYDYSYVVHHPYDLLMHGQPIIQSEVIIDRGNTQAFEKHIRLSEIKTLEDMVSFNNGSFYNVKSDDVTY